jgi:hypothetical protein
MDFDIMVMEILFFMSKIKKSVYLVLILFSSPHFVGQTLTVIAIYTVVHGIQYRQAVWVLNEPSVQAIYATSWSVDLPVI